MISFFKAKFSNFYDYLIYLILNKLGYFNISVYMIPWLFPHFWVLYDQPPVNVDIEPVWGSEAGPSRYFSLPEVEDHLRGLQPHLSASSILNNPDQVSNLLSRYLLIFELGPDYVEFTGTQHEHIYNIRHNYDYAYARVIELQQECGSANVHQVLFNNFLREINSNHPDVIKAYHYALEYCYLPHDIPFIPEEVPNIPEQQPIVPVAPDASNILTNFVRQYPIVTGLVIMATLGLTLNVGVGVAVAAFYPLVNA